jgi:KaiC/GvpD/RAD55 family RecA-like ATPase
MASIRTELLERLIGSETKAELLMYFHDNPDSTDTVEGIAAKIKRLPKEIERDVSDLVELGLLQEVRVISFSKDRDQELQKEISKRLVSVASSEETTPSANRDLTGVGMVDTLLPEGYPSSTVVMVMGDPASGKTTLLVQLVAAALKKGRSVVYAALDDFPDSIRESMKQMGVNPRDYEVGGRNRLAFIDCYSFLVGVRSQEEYSEDPQRLSDLSIVVTKALSETRESSNVLLAMDSLTTLIQRSGVRPSFDFLHTLIAKVRSSRASCVTTLSRKAFHPAIIAAIQDKVDGVIEMKVEDAEDGLARFIRVSKMKGVQHITTWTPYSRESSMGLITRPESVAKKGGLV